MSSIKNNNSTVVPIILAGLAAGAAVWYFLKTEKGRETSKALVDTLEEFGNSFKEKAAESLSKLSNQADIFKDKAVSKFKSASSEAESAFSDYETSNHGV